MKEWTESSLITNLPKWHEDNEAVQTKALAKFIVTLHFFKIGFEQILIEELGPVVWEYAANYHMSRYYMKDVDLDKFT